VPVGTATSGLGSITTLRFQRLEKLGYSGFLGGLVSNAAAPYAPVSSGALDLPPDGARIIDRSTNTQSFIMDCALLFTGRAKADAPTGYTVGHSLHFGRPSNASNARATVPVSGKVAIAGQVAEAGTGENDGPAMHLARQSGTTDLSQHSGSKAVAAFADASGLSFFTQDAIAPRYGVLLGLSARTAIGEAASLYVRYDGEFAVGNTNRVLSAGLRYVW
jgi:hypothetical protein